MKTKDMTFRFDSTDLDAMRTLMANYSNSDTIFTGVNTEGEEVTISIFPQRIFLVTFQNNGWVRHNTYWPDGTCDEKFAGRWKSASGRKES